MRGRRAIVSPYMALVSVVLLSLAGSPMRGDSLAEAIQSHRYAEAITLVG